MRRAIGRSTPPVRVSLPRPSALDPWRERITQWLREEPKVTAKRIRRLLLPLTGPVPARTVRRYVAGLRAAVAPKEAFVHRSVRAGTTMEVDFGESWVDIAGVPRKVKYLVATLPFSNAYFGERRVLETPAGEPGVEAAQGPRVRPPGVRADGGRAASRVGDPSLTLRRHPGDNEGVERSTPPRAQGVFSRIRWMASEVTRNHHLLAGGVELGPEPPSPRVGVPARRARHQESGPCRVSPRAAPR